MQEPPATPELSQPAKLALMSLEEHPDLNSPYAISTGPFGLQQVTTGDIERGLRELEDAKLACQSFTGWSVVEQ